MEVCGTDYLGNILRGFLLVVGSIIYVVQTEVVQY